MIRYFVSEVVHFKLDWRTFHLAIVETELNSDITVSVWGENESGIKTQIFLLTVFFRCHVRTLGL